MSEKIMEDEEPKKPDSLENILNNGRDEKVEIMPPRDIEPSDPDDYEFARQHIRNTIELGNDAMAELIEVARSSGHPRAYEVLTNHMKAMVDASRELMETKKTDQQVKFIDSRKSAPEVTHNNLFVGTTADLARMIEERTKKKS